MIVLAAAALAAGATPAAAQAPLSPEAEESLECAVWASYYAVEYQDQDEGAALAQALSYFVGRYEGLTGTGIDKATDEAPIVDAANSLDRLTPVCTARMQAYGTRMTEWGKALQAIGDSLPEETGGPTS